jgi:cytochrome c oxidase subunit 4
MATYYKVFGFLMVMLLLTVGAWWVDQYMLPLGVWSMPITLAIATGKAVAIVLIFMHVKFSSRLVQIFAGTGVAFVFIMFLLTFSDYMTRGWVPIAGR